MHVPQVRYNNAAKVFEFEAQDSAPDRGSACTRKVMEPVRRLPKGDSFAIYYITDIDLDAAIRRRYSHKCTEVEVQAICERTVDSFMGDIADSQSPSYLVIGGNLSTCHRICEMFLTELAGRYDPKHVVFVPGDLELGQPIEDSGYAEAVDGYRATVEGLGMTFLESQLLILKGGCRNIYDAPDLMSAASADIREEIDGSHLVILGGSGIPGTCASISDLYNHIFEAVPSTDLIVVSCHSDVDRYNVMWTYVASVVETDCPSGIRMFSDNRGGEGPHLRMFEASSFPRAFVSTSDGSIVLTPEQYVEMFSRIDVPWAYAQEKNVTVVTESGYHMFVQHVRVFTTTILNGGNLVKVDHPLDYLRGNMVRFVENTRSKITPYYLRLREVSAAVRSVGGLGEIDGCTVVVGDRTKLFVDPKDHSLALYTAVPKAIHFNDSFDVLMGTDFEPVCDRLRSDPEAREFLALRDVSGELPPYLNRNGIRRMVALTDCLMSTVDHGIIRLWDDRLLDPETDIGDIIVERGVE